MEQVRMGQHDNGFGLVYTAGNADSVPAFEAAVASYLGAARDTMELLQAIVQADPDMPLALCFRGYLLKLAAHPQFAGAIAACLSETDAALARVGGTERERAHAEALRLWSEDRADQALEALESVLANHPLDMLALRIAHYLHFYNGLPEYMRDSIARVLPAWNPDHPQYGYLLGMHAFGLEEAGDYEHALAQGRAAVERDATDIWATHAVTHVYQMQGRHAEGVDWLQVLRAAQAHTNNFRFHVIWHEALHWLGQGDTAQALAIYDDELAASVQDDFYLDVCNNASLLWRLEFAGVDVGERWQALAEIAAPHADDRELVFASLHYLIPLVKMGRGQAEQLLGTLQAWADSGSEQGGVCADIGVALAHAIAQSPQAPARAAEMLLEGEQSMFRIGGSHAQRELFKQLAMHDARRANRPDLVAAAS